MDVVKGYFDYCLADTHGILNNLENTIKHLVDLGYRTVAINQVICEDNLEMNRKKKKGDNRDVFDVVPPPRNFDNVKIECEDFKLLNRLTVEFSHPEVFNRIMKSPNYKKYHIIAILPRSQPAFLFTCNSIEADILTFNTEDKLNFKLNRKLCGQLRAKNFYFEILYSPAILDSTHRKHIITLAHLLHVYGKSKNIIVSSGATNTFLLRSSYDVINLGLIFGLSEEQCKNAILNNGRDVFIYAVGRRHGKAVMLLENTERKRRKEPLVIDLVDDDEVIIEITSPAQKKSKQ